MANNLGSLVVSLGLDAAEFTRGLTKGEYEAQKTSARLRKEFAGVATFIGGLGLGTLFVGSIRNAANYADEMGKLAQRAGVTAEAISGLAYAARLSDVDNATLAKGLRALGSDAAQGGEKLAALGVRLNDAAGKAKTSDALFAEVSDRLAGIEDPARRAAVAAEIFGAKVGPELIPLLAGGSKGLKDMTDEAARFGKVVKDEAAARAAEFNDNLTRLSAQAEGMASLLGGPVIGSLARTSSYFIKVANDVGIARAALITFGAAVSRVLGVDDVGRLQSEARANTNAIALTVKQLETFQALADRGVSGASQRVEQLRAQYAKLQADGQRITSALKSEAQSIDDEYKPNAGSPLPPTDTSLFGGKGGKSQADRERERAEADYQQMLRDYVNDTDAYIQQRHANRMKEQEATEKQYLQDLADYENAQHEYVWQRNLKLIEEEQKAREDAAKAVGKAQEDQARRLGDAYASTLDRAFREGMKLGDLLKKLAFDAINIQFLTPAAQKAGGALGSAVTKLFSSFDGGGYTGSGSRSGGLDGKGGFMALLHPNETVLDHTRGQGMGGGGMSFSYSIDARGADAGVEQRVRMALAESEQRIRAAIVPTVVSAAGRGGAVAKALGRA